MLEDVKKSLRVSNTAFDDEITDLMEEAKADLVQSGLSSVIVQKDNDPLIKRAIKTYCKAHFGIDNPQADRFQQSYDLLKQHLSMAGDYHGDSLE
jgi:uncharacterized phage protein (predicted DNA packaging)